MTVTYEVCPVCSVVLNQDHAPVQSVMVRTATVQIEATLNETVRSGSAQNVTAQIGFLSVTVLNEAILNALGARSCPVARVLREVLHCEAHSVPVVHCVMVHCVMVHFVMAHFVAARCAAVALHFVAEVRCVAGVLRSVAASLLARAEHCFVVVRRLAWVTRYDVPVGTARRVRDSVLVFHSNPKLD